MIWTPPQHRLMADISDYQAAVDLRAYRKAGRQVIMIKAGEGTGSAGAARYPTRADEAHRNGLTVVHYLMAVFSEDAQSSLAAFCSRIAPHWQPGDRMLIDVEDYSGTPTEAIGWLADAQHYLTVVKNAPRALAYTNEAYLAEGGPILADQAPWWLVAAYDNRLLGARGTPIIPGRTQLLGKQYTDGTIGAGPHATPGIGACDNSILTCAGLHHLDARPPALKRQRLPRNKSCPRAA